MAWQHLDAEVVPYHWDDRSQYEQDSQYLEWVYEEFLRRTAAALNKHHGTAHSTRYWRILIGPWLYIFTHILLDRWKMVERAAASYEIEGTLICEFPPASMIPPDLRSLPHQYAAWNHYVFGKAIEFQNGIRWQKIAVSGDVRPGSISQVRPSFARSALIGAKSLVSWLLTRLTRSSEALVIQSYLPTFEEIKLQLALGQVPKLWLTPRCDTTPADVARRGRLTIGTPGPDAFLRFVASMIPEQIPTVYFEGYQNLRRTAARLPWPSRPRVIFTSNLFQFCEVFQQWSATKTEAGYPLVIGQHGGQHGIGKRVTGENHQVRICDRYLTWGWRDERPQTCPAAILTCANRSVGTWNPAGNLLLVTMAMPLFSYRSMSYPVGPNQSRHFVEAQLRFAATLDERIRACLTARIPQAADRHLRTGYIERWKDALPGVAIDPSTAPIEHAIRRCRLFVYTYNSTGFLETLSRNIPTLVFWNPWYFELRREAQPYFDMLARARIFHETPESAAAHVRQIWDDVAAWWTDAAVQDARRTFCEQYARMPRHPLREIKAALRSARPRAAANVRLERARFLDAADRADRL